MAQISKPTEEGDIYEWRAFGVLTPELVARVKACPIRNDILDHKDVDIYLIPPEGNQNVKLRKLPDRWVLKLKPFLRGEARSIELYRESGRLVHDFPVGRTELEQAAEMLGVQAPDLASVTNSLAPDEFVTAITACSAPISSVEAPKTRSQFEIEGGWIELAEVAFPKLLTASISIQSFDLSVVEHALDEFRPEGALRMINYVQACRLWG